MMNILVTDSALSELRRAKEQDVQYIRMGVLPGGCSGFKYSLALEEATSDDDVVVDAADDIKILVDPFSMQYLEGIELDYVTTLTASGFQFNNPNATGGCGCGSSFNA
jgi:iron-sulfur cluster assembly protein